MASPAFGWTTATQATAGVLDHAEFKAPASGEIELYHIRLGPNSAATAVEHMGFQRKSVAMTGSARTPLALNTRSPAKAGTYVDFASVTGTFVGSELLMLCAGRPNDEHTQWSAPRPNAVPTVVNGEIMGGKQSGTTHLFIETYVLAENTQGTTPTSRNNGGRRPTQRGNWGFQSRSCFHSWWSSAPVGVAKVQQNHVITLPLSLEPMKFRKSWNVIFGGSGTTFFQAVTAAATGTASFVNRVGKNVTASGTGTPVFVNRVGKFVTSSATGTPTLVKSANKPLTATATGTPLLASVITRIQALTAAATGTVVIVRRAGKIVAAASTATPTIIRTVGKVVAAAATGTPVIVRRVGKILAATSTGTAALTTTKVVFQVLTAAASGTVVVVRSTGKIVSAAATGAATITRRAGKAVTASATGAATVTRGVSKTLAAAAAGAVTLVTQFISGGVISYVTGFFSSPNPAGASSSGPAAGAFDTGPEAGQASSSPATSDFDSPNPGLSA